MKVKNPILRGFYPDPSIVRVGDDYYIANSTFEWWPGVSKQVTKVSCFISSQHKIIPRIFVDFFEEKSR